eukprot:scaffold8442_cov82-Cylindrotheca_fusiformis.AAC.1
MTCYRDACEFQTNRVRESIVFFAVVGEAKRTLHCSLNVMQRDAAAQPHRPAAAIKQHAEMTIILDQEGQAKQTYLLALLETCFLASCMTPLCC